MTPRLAGRAVAAVLSHQVKECSGLGQPADLGHSSYIQEPGVRRSAGGNMAARRGASVLEVIKQFNTWKAARRAVGTWGRRAPER